MTRQTSNFPRPKQIIAGVLVGLGALGLCICAAGVGGAGVYYFIDNRSTTDTQPSVEYILDASPRMEAPAEGGTRLSVAQAVLAEIVRPADTLVTAGLRVFGTGAVAAACQDTRLLVPLAPDSQSRIAESVFSLTSGASVDSALAQAMLAAIRDLSKTIGPQTVVVITGGADSCDAQASELIRQEIERAGIQLETFVIGFQVDAQEALAIKAMIEAIPGSTYLNAPDEAALRSILAAIQNHIDHPSTAWQAPGSAYVQTVRDSGQGTFVTSQMSAPRPLVAGSYLEAGDGSKISTGPEFSAKLILDDQIVLWVGPESEIELTRLASPMTGETATEVRLLLGSLLTQLSDTLAPESTYSIISPINQRAQVIGSVMGTRYDPQDQIFHVDCFEGHCRAGQQALVACQHVSIEKDLAEQEIEPAQPLPYAFSEEDLTWDCGSGPAATSTSTASPTHIATTPPTSIPAATVSPSVGAPAPVVPGATATALPPTPSATTAPTSVPPTSAAPPPTNPPPPPPTNPPPPPPTNPPPPPPDRDGDGFPDSDDACPDTPGPDHGCPAPPPPPPDRDGDGFPDSNDACPDTPGPDRGCPIVRP